MADELILETTTAVVLELEVGTPGPPGKDGADGSGSVGSTNTFIQTTDPVLALVPGFGPYIWYVTDATGAVLDIRKGAA